MIPRIVRAPCRPRGVACLVAAAAIVALAAPTRAEEPAYVSNAPAEWNPKQQFLDALPPAVSDGLDIDGWAWFSYLHNSNKKSDFTDTMFSLSVTKSFAQRVAVGIEANLINADGLWRGELQQLYLSLKPSDQWPAILTLGKFNTNFGLEERDFWNRTHGTTSLLFGAQPQDLVGLIAKLPIGDTGIALRPFIGLDIQGQFNYDQPPLGGLQAQYEPSSDLSLSWTNIVGPGLVVWGGQPLRHPYPQGGYGGQQYGGEYVGGAATAIENWQGPNFYAERGGTLYFSDANIQWRPRNDLTLGAEGLVGTTGTSDKHVGWWGAMVTADFNVTDRFWLFGRYSCLDDADWLVYGTFQKLYEVSGGVGYRIFDKVEIRAEYRHDRGSETGNSDSISVHVTAGF